jgi:hypothetical protein
VATNTLVSAPTISVLRVSRLLGLERVGRGQEGWTLVGALADGPHDRLAGDAQPPGLVFENVGRNNSRVIKALKCKGK